mmetsp:Transcript_21111/g.86186  ORF Transcript_21111/g.86186 Transcript_21111/m.86186 type:complete len:152 (-) Transcript_21111:2703-3158(-)
MRLNHNRFVQRIKENSQFKESVARLVVAEKAADPKEAEKKLLEEIEFPKDARKPRVLDLLPFQIIKLPYIIGKFCFDQIRWQVRYTWLKKEYTAEDEIIAIQMAMRYEWHNLSFSVCFPLMRFARPCFIPFCPTDYPKPNGSKFPKRRGKK